MRRVSAAIVLLAGSALLAGCGDAPITAPASSVRPAEPAPPAPPPPPAFEITVRFVGDGGTPAQRDAFTRAAARWSSVIASAVDPTPLDVPAGECATWLPAVKETSQALLVFVRIASIDGAGKIVGQATPCYVSSTRRLPVMGFFELDQDDLAAMVARGMLDNVVLHEMGHILGIGTLWNFRRTLLTGSGTDDPYFSGSAARDAFARAGGATYLGTPVPVENAGGTGTRDAHWRRSVFGAELMQGYAQPGPMPISAITLASLQDLGYTVTAAAADPYALPRTALRLDAPPDDLLPLGDDVPRAPLYEVGDDGRRRRAP